VAAGADAEVAVQRRRGVACRRGRRRQPGARHAGGEHVLGPGPAFSGAGSQGRRARPGRAAALDHPRCGARALRAGGRPGRERGATGQSPARCRPDLQPRARADRGGRLRRLFPAGQPRPPGAARVQRGRADRPSTAGLRACGRSCAHGGADPSAARRRRAGGLRESQRVQGRGVPLARVDGDPRPRRADHLRRRP
jgi:hypothetical protein